MQTLAKCEQTMGAALSQLGGLVHHHLGPVLERVTVELEEALGWALWPSQTALALDPVPIRRAIALAGQLLQRATDLERAIRHEWQAFPELRKWLRTEVERATAIASTAAAQASMTGPQRAREREREKTAKPNPALFYPDVVVIADHLQDYGGKAQAILSALEFDLAAARSAWDDELPPEPASMASDAPRWTEVKAALDAFASGGGVRLQRPPDRDRSVGESLPLMFAELARVAGIAFGRPLQRIGANARAEGPAAELAGSLPAADTLLHCARSVRSLSLD